MCWPAHALSCNVTASLTLKRMTCSHAVHTVSHPGSVTQAPQHACYETAWLEYLKRMSSCLMGPTPPIPGVGINKIRSSELLRVRLASTTFFILAAVRTANQCSTNSCFAILLVFLNSASRVVHRCPATYYLLLLPKPQMRPPQTTSRSFSICVSEFILTAESPSLLPPPFSISSFGLPLRRKVCRPSSYTTS